MTFTHSNIIRQKESMHSIQFDIIHGENHDAIALGIRNALERGWLKSFGPFLDESKQHCLNDIDRVCSRHADGLLRSLKDLVSLQQSSDNLYSSVEAIRNVLTTASGSLLSDSEHLFDIKAMRGRLKRAQSVLLLCKAITRKICETDEGIQSFKSLQKNTASAEINSTTFHTRLFEMVEWYRQTVALLNLLKAVCRQPSSADDCDGTALEPAGIDDNGSVASNHVAQHKGDKSTGQRHIFESSKFAVLVEESLAREKSDLLAISRVLVSAFINELSSEQDGIGRAMFRYELALAGGFAAKQPLASERTSTGHTLPSMTLRDVLVRHRDSLRCTSWASTWDYRSAIPDICFCQNGIGDNYDEKRPAMQESSFSFSSSSSSSKRLGTIRASIKVLHLGFHVAMTLDEPKYLHDVYCALRVPILARTARLPHVVIDRNDSGSSSPSQMSSTRGDTDMMDDSCTTTKTEGGRLHELVRSKGLGNVIETLCAELSGAFIVEGMIMTLFTGEVSQDSSSRGKAHVHAKTKIPLISLSELQELWRLARVDLRNLLSHNISNLASPEEVLKVKEILLLTSQAMAEHGDIYRELPLSTIVSVMTARFIELQAQDMADVTAEAFDESGFQPLVVSDAVTYLSSIVALTLDKLEFDGIDPFVKSEEPSYSYDTEEGPSPFASRLRSDTSVQSTDHSTGSVSALGSVASSKIGGRRGLRRSMRHMSSIRASSIAAVIGGSISRVGTRIKSLRNVKLSPFSRKSRSSPTSGLTSAFDAADDHSGIASTRPDEPAIQCIEKSSSFDILSPITRGRHIKAMSSEHSLMLDSLEENLFEDRWQACRDESVPPDEFHAATPTPTAFAAPVAREDDALSVSSFSSASQSMSASASRNFVQRRFPFSSAVPKVLKRLFVVLARAIAFMVRVPIMSADGTYGGHGVLQCVERALDAMVGVLKDDFDHHSDEISIAKACQMGVDCSTIAYGLPQLRIVVFDVLDAENIRTSQDNVDAIFTRCLSKLEHVSIRANDHTLELLSSKVDMLMESLCFIDWDGYDIEAGPHDIISGLTEFLVVTMSSLNQLPTTTFESIHFAICARISRNLLDFIFDEDTNGNQITEGHAPAKIGMVCWLRLDKDVKLLEGFADACGVSQLRHCFKQLREYTAAMLSPDLAALAANPVRMRNAFATVDPRKLADLLEKTTPVPKGRATAMTLPKRDPSENRRLAKILRALDV